MGNTKVDNIWHFIPPVHPHTRGEHFLIAERMPAGIGSSPHTWGTQLVKKSSDPVRRFIPTHVGNTGQICCCLKSVPVHPHTRGEHGCMRPMAVICTGSSPHTWGTPHLDAEGLPHERFIPTHVGNTAHGQAVSAPHTVHPHTRGEHWDGDNDMHDQDGSSPHTWGTRRCGERWLWMRTVHPHTRGEHLQWRNDCLWSGGSSPHTWGTLILQVRYLLKRRFIPTHVGNTQGFFFILKPFSVHPHTRGEHAERKRGHMRAKTVHPHTRGEH